MMGILLATPIHPITGWHSLFPTSYTRTTFGLSYDWLTWCPQERYGLTLFHITDVNGLGPVYPPVAFGAHVHSDYKNASSYFAFWLKPVSVFGLYMVYDVYQRFTYVDHTIQT